MGVGAPTTTVVIDNGGHTCKVGFAGQAEPVKSMPNGIAKSKTEHKVFVADQLDACTGAVGELVAVLTQQRGDLRSDGSGAQQRHPQSAVIGHSFPSVVATGMPASRARRSSMVSPRTITRAAPSPTAITGGRGT